MSGPSMTTLWLAGLLALATIGQQLPTATGSRVLELGDRFLDVKHEGQWLVMFYAPWCGHCKRSEPIWLQVAQSLANTNVRVGRVDCTRFTSVGAHFKINSYPTIMFLKGDKQHVYSGDRTKEDLLPYAWRMSGPPVQPVTRPESIEALRARHDLLFMYVGAESGALWDTYNAVAANFQAHGFFFATDERVAAGAKLELGEGGAPCVAVLKANSTYFYPKNDRTSIASDAELAGGFEGSAEASVAVVGDHLIQLNQTLTQWVNEERFPHFMKVTRANIHQVMQTGKYLVLAIVEENKLNELASHEHDFRELMENFTHKYYDQYHRGFQFGWVGQPELAHSIALDIVELPNLLVLNVHTAEHHLHSNCTANITHQMVSSFLDDIREERLEARGGNRWSVRLYRMYFETWRALGDMWKGNPVLTSVVFGLPLGFLSLIMYSICCADILDASEEEEDDDPDAQHEKRE